MQGKTQFISVHFKASSAWEWKKNFEANKIWWQRTERLGERLQFAWASNLRQMVEPPEVIDAWDVTRRA